MAEWWHVLSAIPFALAARVSIVWLKFDSDAGVVDGLPVYEDDDGEEPSP